MQIHTYMLHMCSMSRHCAGMGGHLYQERAGVVGRSLNVQQARRGCVVSACKDWVGEFVV